MNPANPPINSDQPEMPLESELPDQSSDSDEEGISTNHSTTSEPEFSAPLHHPMPTAPPGRPCLKRTSSASPVRSVVGDLSASSIQSNLPVSSGRRSVSEGYHSGYGYNSDHSSSDGNGNGSDSNNNQENDNSSRFPFNCSFAAPRRFSSQKKTVQQVRFETSPQAYLTHSSTNYDRTPIKCTKGSELDLSMPPRCSKREESDEEADDEAEASGINKVEDEKSDKMRLDYFGRWANLKRGTIIGGIKNEEEVENAASSAPPFYQGSFSSTAASASPSNSSPCALPFRGVRSFGGLCSKQNSSEELSPADQSSLSSRSSTPPATTFESLVNDDATPMPSPSVRRSLAQPFARGSEGRQGQLQSFHPNSGSYFDLARTETDLETSNGGGSESGTETARDEKTLDEAEPDRIKFVRISRAMNFEGDQEEMERGKEVESQPSTSSLLSACDLDWTLVSSTGVSSRNGHSPASSSRSSRSNSREEAEPLSAESCSEIEAVRQMLRRHALENRLSSRPNEMNSESNGLSENTGITSPPLSPLSSEDSSIDDQSIPNAFSQHVNFPITPAADETFINSLHSPALKKSATLSNGSETDSNREYNSSPISFLSSNLSTSNSISSFSSLASSPMSSRSSSLENWMNPILGLDSLKFTKKEIGEDGSKHLENLHHHQRFADSAQLSSCNTSINGSLSDDANGIDSPPTNDSSSATSPELLPADHQLYHNEFRNAMKSQQKDDHFLIDRLNSVQRLAGKEDNGASAVFSIQNQLEEVSSRISCSGSPNVDSPPSSSADPKTKSKTSDAASTKKKGLSAKCKARKERELERERERVRELLGEEGDCLGGF